jgi:type IV pilus assembly protein PilM
VNAAQKAGLKVIRVDLSSFGALRSVAGGGPAVQAVVDIGAHLTSIVIHRDGIPRLVRTVVHGGEELTDLLVEGLSLSSADAEQQKAEIGLTGADIEVAGLLRAGIRPLLAEIRSSANYFRSTNDGVRLEGIVLTGGGSRLAGLADAVDSQLGVPTTVGSALSHVVGTTAAGSTPQPDPDRAGSVGTPEMPDPAATAVSIGLALGAAA